MDIYVWILIPLGIFFARVCDVSLGTIRIIFISRGLKLAALISFIEMLIWLLAIRVILTDMANIGYYLAFAGGFASGTYVGMYVERKLSLGVVIIRVVTKKDASNLIQALKELQFGITTIKGDGEGPVTILFSVIQRHDLPKFVSTIKIHNPNAFYSIEDIRSVSEGIFPQKNYSNHNKFRLLSRRKEK